jgi:hypothetical protein
MQNSSRPTISGPRRLQRSDSQDRHMPPRPSTPSISIPSRSHEHVQVPRARKSSLLPHQFLEERFPPRSRTPDTRNLHPRPHTPFIYGVDHLSPLEEELADLHSLGSKPFRGADETLKWAREQHAADIEEARRRASSRVHQYHVRKPTIFDWEAEADRWMELEEASQRQTRYGAQRAQRVEEEVQRIQVRIRERRHSESSRMEEARRDAQRALKKCSQKTHPTANQPMLEAWRKYGERWNLMLSTAQPLTFQSIPWPVAVRLNDPVQLYTGDIMAFLFSPQHSVHQSRRDRLKAALLQWHPDRFQRLLSRVVEEDRSVVEEGVNIVARCLNELLNRESNFLSPVSSFTCEDSRFSFSP